MLLTPKKFLKRVGDKITKPEILMLIDTLVERDINYEKFKEAGLFYYVYANKHIVNGNIEYGLSLQYQSKACKDANRHHTDAFKLLNHLAH